MKSHLHLTLNRKWFDMIINGQKKEEYRDIKPYWQTRLFHKDGTPKDFDYVQFRNGYSPESPVAIVEFRSARINTGNPEWGATDGERYYVITLGRVVHFKNCNHCPLDEHHDHAHHEFVDFQ